MSKSMVGSIVLCLSVICFVKCDTNVEVSAPQKSSGELSVLIWFKKSVFLVKRFRLFLFKTMLEME